LKHFVHTVALGALVLALSPAAPAEAAQKRVAKKATHASVVKVPRASKTFSASRETAVVKKRSVVRLAPPRLSFGQLAGLHEVQDDLDLKSAVALVIDQDTREVLFRKNDSAVLPIASLTKLMTGMIISEAKLPMD
jgi:serine-type D-Ala-D-Ala endopeptidase (penicillin-binding protein 7)